jgi:hypothetical protein
MKNMIVKALLLFGVVALTTTGCNNNNDLTSGNSTTLTDVAQTSGQLASGSSFTISGSSSSTGSSGSGTTVNPGPPAGGPHKGPGGGEHGLLEGTSLLAPTDQLLAIIEAESAGDFRGMRMHQMGGATVTNYDASGNAISMPPPPQNSGGPEGCSFSGKQFPKFDSLLVKVAKTVIDFGTGVTDHHGDRTITRSGKITITRGGDNSSKTETITFENYKVNGALIEGTRIRVNTFDANGGSSQSHVVDGKITFSDGTASVWTSSKSRTSSVVLNANNRPISGQIVTEGSTGVTATDGTLIYSHNITKSLIENIGCGPGHHAPVSGTVETVYNTDKLSIDFGDGSCSNTKVTVTLNGVVTTKTLDR